MDKICSVEQCERKTYGLGFCSAHYQQFKKYGHIIRKTLKNQNKGKLCKVDGCGLPSKNNGYCNRHNDQMRDHGEILGVGLMRAKPIGVGMMKQKGYIYLLRKGHPRANKDGYVKRANIVWEEATGHMIVPPEVLHHKNEIKTDDSLGNLQLCKDKSEHNLVHIRTGRWLGRELGRNGSHV
ncbi:MAG: hypothetical protein LLG40_10015 [Deltaproteobacteria bacterium]|nr:hypothetical protein [Deltaproteobacteria bacterium]